MSKPNGYSVSKSGDNRVTSFLIFNFPETWSRVDCRNVFENYGALEDVYFARKRLSSGQRFGYVRFVDITDIDSFTKVLNTIQVNGKWIRAYKALERNGAFRSSSKDRGNNLNDKDFPPAPWNLDPSKPIKWAAKSFADSVTGSKHEYKKPTLPESNRIEIRVGDKIFDFNLPKSVSNHNLVFSFSKDRVSWTLVEVNKIRVIDDGEGESNYSHGISNKRSPNSEDAKVTSVGDNEFPSEGRNNGTCVDRNNHTEGAESNTVGVETNIDGAESSETAEVDVDVEDGEIAPEENYESSAPFVESPVAVFSPENYSGNGQEEDEAERPGDIVGNSNDGCSRIEKSNLTRDKRDVEVPMNFQNHLGPEQNTTNGPVSFNTPNGLGSFSEICTDLQDVTTVARFRVKEKKFPPLIKSHFIKHVWGRSNMKSRRCREKFRWQDRYIIENVMHDSEEDDDEVDCWVSSDSDSECP